MPVSEQDYLEIREIKEQSKEQMSILTELRITVAGIKEKLDNAPICGTNCPQTKSKELDRRVDILEKEKTWLYRLLIGAVILQVVGLVLIK